MDSVTSTSDDDQEKRDAADPKAASLEAAPDDDFYSGAVRRIRAFMSVLALALTAAGWWRFGRWPALGFALGCAIAFLNFHWLKSGVSSLADRVTNSNVTSPGVTNPGKPTSGKGIVARFLLRYVLLGAAAYVILTSFPASLRGLFAGLCLPVGAIACEAAYEVYVAVRSAPGR